MEGIWTGLKRANAQAVFACSLAALVVVGGWWTWRLLTPSTLPTPAIVPPAPESASSGLGLLDILHRQRGTFTNQTARNPFLLPEGVAPRTRQSGRKTEAAPVSSPPAAVEKPAPPPPPKRPPIHLTYRGSLTRSDGTVTALIEDSRSSRSVFYPAGTNLFGLRLERIAPGEIALTGDSDRQTILKRGETAALEEPEHAH